MRQILITIRVVVWLSMLRLLVESRAARPNVPLRHERCVPAVDLASIPTDTPNNGTVPHLSLLSQTACQKRLCPLDDERVLQSGVPVYSQHNLSYMPTSQILDSERVSTNKRGDIIANHMMRVTLLLPPWTYFNKESKNVQDFAILASKLLLQSEEVVVFFKYFVGPPCVHMDASEHMDHHEVSRRLEQQIWKSIPCNNDETKKYKMNWSSRLRFQAFEMPTSHMSDPSVYPWCGSDTHRNASNNHNRYDKPWHEYHPYSKEILGTVAPEITANHELLHDHPHVVVIHGNHIGGLLLAEHYRIPIVVWANPSYLNLWATPTRATRSFQARHDTTVLSWIRDRYNSFVLPFQNLNRYRWNIQLPLLRTPREILTRAHLILLDSFPAMYERGTRPRLPKNAIWMGPLLPECTACEPEHKDPHNGRAKSKLKSDHIPQATRLSPSLLVLPMQGVTHTKARLMLRGLTMAKRSTEIHHEDCSDRGRSTKSTTTNNSLNCTGADEMIKWDVVWLTKQEDNLVGLEPPFESRPNGFECTSYRSLWQFLADRPRLRILVSFCGSESHGWLSAGAHMLCLPRDKSTFSSVQEQNEFVTAQERVAYLSGGQVVHDYHSVDIANAVIRILQNPLSVDERSERLRAIDWHRADHAAGYIARIGRASKFTREEYGEAITQAQVAEMLREDHEFGRVDPSFDVSDDEPRNGWKPFLAMEVRQVAWTVLFLVALSCFMLPEMPGSVMWRRRFRHCFRYGEEFLETLDTTYHHFQLWVDDEDSFHCSVERKLQPLTRRAGEAAPLTESGQDHHGKKGTHGRRRRQVKRR